MAKPNSYVPAIDGLRAIAVAAVLLFHLDASLLPGGFTGVDVFFVISGYVVARSLSSRCDSSFREIISGFYSRRIRRIIPALTLCLLTTTVLTVLFIPESWLSDTVRLVGLYAFVGLSNFALVQFSDDYFSPRAEFNPFVHTWSLGVEEQFYFLFPLLMFIWLKFKDRKSTPIIFISKHSFLLLAFASFIMSIHFGENKPDWAFYLLPSRFWELAAGVIIFQLQLQRKIEHISGSAANILIAFGILLIGIGYFWADPETFPYPWAVLPVLGTSLVILGVSDNINGTSQLARPLLLLPVQYIGKISYSLYLWHWPVYTLMRWTTGIDTTTYKIVAILLTILLATASYHLFETPIRRAGWLAKPNYRSIIAGLISIAVFLTVATELFHRQSQFTLSSTGERLIWYPYKYPTNLPSEQALMLKNREMFVVGNSHTGAYATMLGMLEQQTEMKTHLFQVGSCAFGNLLYPVRNIPGCARVIDNYLNLLRENARPGDIVFFASLRTHRLSDQWYRLDPTTVLATSKSEAVKASIEEAYIETDSIVEAIFDMGLLVMFDAPKPVLPSPVYRCADWFNQANPICSDHIGIDRNFMEELRTPVLDSMNKFVSNRSRSYLWDPLPFLCDAVECHAYSSTGEPIFFDGDHLSAHGNRVLYPSFKQFVKDIYKQCLDCPKAGPRMPHFKRHIELNESLSFSASGQGIQYLGEGWANPELWGVWSKESQVTLFLPVQPNSANTIRVEAVPFLSGDIQQQRVHVFINNQGPKTFFLNEHSSSFDISIPPLTQNSTEKAGVVLEFHLPDHVSPAELGVSDDYRKLALALRSVTLLNNK